MINPYNLSANMSAAFRVVPSLSGVRLVRTWAGVGLATPDLAPISAGLGPGALSRVPVPYGPEGRTPMGRVLSHLALDLPPEVDLEPPGPVEEARDPIAVRNHQTPSVREEDQFVKHFRLTQRLLDREFSEGVREAVQDVLSLCAPTSRSPSRPRHCWGPSASP